MKILSAIFILLLASSLTGQQIDLKGVVFDRITRKPIQDAEVSDSLSGSTTLTDQLGGFTIRLTNNTAKIKIIHKNYEPQTITWTYDPEKAFLKIRLKPLHPEQIVTFWRNHKNAISFSFLEMFIGALGVRYERSLNNYHAVGVYTSIYLIGKNPEALGFENVSYPRYHGFRLSPFYRFYPLSREYFGLFAEIKGHLGYIYFAKLPYHYGLYGSGSVNKEYSFWNIGYAASIGITIKLPKNNPRFINISVGYQHFPIDVPESVKIAIDDNNVLIGTTNTAWWYHGGPGTRLDIKFTMGGIF